MHHKLIETKLHPPRVSETLVSRSRLIDLLEVSAKENPRPIIISAPAGYGKTTLVVDWLTSSGARFAWVTLDKSDNDITRFIQYVFAALYNASGQIGYNSLELIKAPVHSIEEALATSMVSDLSMITSRTILILDDYHEINNRSIHELVHNLLANLPQSIIVTLLTREDPPFPLARLRTQDRLVEIRARQLRFSSDETKVFIEKISGIEIEDAISGELIQRTEGWAAGLKLAALSLEGLDDHDARRRLSDFNGSDRHVIDYFGEEVLRNQSERVKKFLSSTAHLSKLRADLCDAVSERSDSAEILTYLTRMSLFVAPIEGEDGWYRYHPLFAVFLDVRLGQSRKTALHKRAAQWYADREMYYDAVKHAARIANRELLEKIITEGAMTLLENGRYATLLEWLDSLPDAKILGEIELAMYKAWALYFQDRAGDAYNMVLRCEKGIPSGSKTRNKSKLHIVGSWIRESLGEPFDARSLRALVVSRKTENPFFSFHACVLCCKVQLRSGDPNEALKSAENAQLLAQDTGNPFFTTCAAHLLAYCYIETGERSQAEKICSRTLNQQSEGDIPGKAFAAILRIPAAFCRYLANDLAGAVSYLNKVQNIIGDPLNSDYLVDDGRYVGALAKLAANDPEGALSVCSKKRKGNYSSFQEALSADVALKENEIGIAVRIMKIENSETMCGSVNLLNYGNIVRLRLLLALDRAAEVERLVRHSEKFADDNGAFGSLLFSNIFLSLAKHQMGATNQAHTCMHRALEIAAVDDFRRPFLDEGDPVEEIIRALNPPRYSFAWSLLSDFKDRGDALPSLSEALSKREREVISLMAKGMSNKEVADSLFISLGTVKWHVNNIYGKLDAKNRTTAINRARDLKLIEEQT